MTGKAAARIQDEAPDMSDVASRGWPYAGFEDGNGLTLPIGDIGEASLVTLALADMMRDANGEVVLFNDSNLRVVVIETARATVREGVSTAHVTLTGENVSGFRYVTFDDGTTIFFQSGLELRYGPKAD